MATAVLDLDFYNLPAEITGLENYCQALILIRLHRRPVGQALLPIIAGRLGGVNLKESILNAADSGFWEQWVRDYLGYQEKEYEPSNLPKATIAVCTRDRPEDLERCLDALMQLPDDGQELLVIDNCPKTDATRQLVARYKKVRYIREDRPGLDVARNKALCESTKEIIAFTDDDATVDPGWLRALLRNFADPRVLCVTGLTMPSELETKAQEWFQRLGGLGRGFKRAVYDHSNCNPLEGWVAGAGVNMALRRGFVERIGLFDEALDVGTPSRGGGDTEIFARLLCAGYRIIYDPEALVWHRHRSQWKELRRQIFGYELSGFAVWMRQLIFRREVEVLKLAWEWLWRELATLVASVLRRPGCTPLDLVLARFYGAALGPFVYLHANRLQSRYRRK